MVGWKGALSREYRELFLRGLSPIPLLSILGLLVVAVSEFPVPYFLLVYGMFLAAFVIFFVRFLRHIRASIREARASSIPELKGIESMTLSEQVQAAVSAFFETGGSGYKHISQQENESIIPKFVYAVLSTFVTIFVWMVITVILGAGIQSGLFALFVESIDNSAVNELSRLVSGTSPVLFILSGPFVPNLSLEAGIIFAAEVFLPGIFFLTAAENIALIIEEYCRRFLRWFHNTNARLRRFEITGWIIITAFLVSWVFLLRFI